MKTISQQSLRGLVAPNETHFVRLIIHEAYNSGRYTLRCRLRDYVFERDNTVGRHILDIPLSLWQKNAASASSAAAWRDNNSLAEDIRQSKANVSFYVLPYDGAAPAAAVVRFAPDVDNKGALLAGLEILFGVYGAPESIAEICDMAKHDASRDEIMDFVFKACQEERENAKTDQPDAPNPTEQSDTSEKVSNDTPPEETPAETPEPVALPEPPPMVAELVLKVKAKKRAYKKTK